MSWKQPQHLGLRIIQGRKSDMLTGNRLGPPGAPWRCHKPGSGQAHLDQLLKVPKGGWACPSALTPWSGCVSTGYRA